MASHTFSSKFRADLCEYTSGNTHFGATRVTYVCAYKNLAGRVTGMVSSLLDPAGTFLIYCRMFRELSLRTLCTRSARDKAHYRGANGILIGYPSCVVDKVTVDESSPGNFRVEKISQCYIRSRKSH